ncbi:PREDICTED: uncharacterized protein LOC104811239 [Tarenaya hassleriana]|uniref:uncharacterized protein LOC104811239 n=1 Tax=Tarenaya hassleriana TaxID=28532 RepID=UPI00053C1EDA|nr:PREDICTED: uncharacterized protein LOC104811239 [Tarenaya hassleriana]
MAVALNAGAGFTSPLHTRYHPVLRSLVKVPPPKATPFESISYINGSRGLISDKRRLVVSCKALDDDDVGETPSLSETREPGNGSASSSEMQTASKRAPLTARERLRAARVLSRYTETAPKQSSKPEMGRKLLDAMKESDKKEKKKPGLPEAPTNLFDDSKRGLPQGFTFQFPGGNEILIIAVSFVLISTAMFATTYLVWKLGAIHFNEY